MDTASYIALSRQMGLFRQMDVIANNIANANTDGYKSESMMFAELVSQSASDAMGRSEGVSFTNDIATIRDVGQGALQHTGRELDAAIDGKGYFVVDTPLGERYTRAGSFQVDSEGDLITSQGYKVRGGSIAFSETDLNITIREDGLITVKTSAGTEERSNLEIVKFENEQALKKVGNGLYTATEIPLAADSLSDYKISQGMVEKSNVNSTTQLTEMIKVNRGVGSASKLIGDLHELQRRAISTISRQN